MASRATVQSAKKDGAVQLDRSLENHRLGEENRRLRKENESLENLQVLLKNQVEGLTKKAKE